MKVQPVETLGRTMRSLQPGTLFRIIGSCQSDFYLRTNDATLTVRLNDGRLCHLEPASEVEAFPDATVSPGIAGASGSQKGESGE